MLTRASTCLLNSSHLQLRSFPKIAALLYNHGSISNYSSDAASLPRVARPSLWHSIVPKFLRKSESSEVPVKQQRSKEWNPATFYIVIFLLIGSNAIQMIALRNDFVNFSRRADAKIGLLKEIIDRVQRGEDVDVEGLLGTGDKEKEKEWEDVLREIEEDDELWQTKSKRRKRAPSGNDSDKSLSSNTTDVVEDAAKNEDAKDCGSTAENQKKPLIGFY